MASQVNEFKRGWGVLVASFFGIGVAINSVLFYTFGLWIVPWQDEFGWSRAQIGGAQTAATIILIAAVPLAGRAIDMFGIRKVAIPSMFLFGVSTYFATFLNGSLLGLYGIVALFALAGAGATPVSFTRAINGWFARNRGLALGLGLMSTGFAGAALPAIFTPYVAEHGWRAAMALLSLIIIAPIPIVWLWIKDRGPEDDAASTEGVETPLVKSDIKRAEFRKLALVFFLIAFGVCGLIPSFIPMLLDAGFSPETAGGYTAIIGVSVIVGRLSAGFLVDRIFAPYVTAVLFSAAALGLAVMALGGASFAIIGAIALGFAIGAEVDLIGYYTARYFGTRNYGALFGILYSCFSAGCAISPLAAGFIWDATGSYGAAFLGAACLLAIAVVITLTLPRFPANDLRALVQS
ncbi:MAG: MFS transporter [Pseudomonadota bacterium]